MPPRPPGFGPAEPAAIGPGGGTLPGRIPNALSIRPAGDRPARRSSEFTAFPPPITSEDKDDDENEGEDPPPPMPPIPRPGISRTSTAKAPAPAPATPRNIVVFSGGSAANALVDVFERLRAANAGTLSYVIPISDNGGSSSELIRVFGGPGIGDVRSRLVRLIPDTTAATSPEMAAIKALFNHRLPRDYAAARAQWLDMIEGTHELWRDVSSPKRELVRSLLNHFNLEAVKRVRPSSRFDFGGASIGNLFLTGARLFTGSLEAAIYLLSSICAVPDTTAVLPALNTNFAHHIAVGLADGTVIAGQNDISHPNVPTAASPVPDANIYSRSQVVVRPQTHHSSLYHAGGGGGGGGGAFPGHRLHRRTNEADDEVEDANLPGTLSALRRPAIEFSKTDEEDLPARIERLWYINPYGEEIRIPANPRVLSAVRGATAVVFSIGSLFTSLVPSLVLRGVGDALASTPTIRHKILILNGTHDRESGPSGSPMTAEDFVAAIARACQDSRIGPAAAGAGGAATPFREGDYSRYVTHVVHLDAPGAPVVDKRRMARFGIETVRLYGRTEGGGRGGARYDVTALAQALEAIVGRGGEGRRRYTFLG